MHKNTHKHVGIIVDIHYKKKGWVHELVQQIPPQGVVVTTTGNAVVFLQETVKRRGDLHFKLYEEDPWGTPKLARKIRDQEFVSYLQITRGKLFFFPSTYDTVDGKRYAVRMQDLIIAAHQRRVPYEIISGEK